MAVLPTRLNDNSEILPYNLNNYRVFTGVECLSDHPNNTMFNHWHNDIELVAPLEGTMEYHINGDTVCLKPGNGVFINAGQMHYGCPEADEDCKFLFLLFHPVLLSATKDIGDRFVAPLLNDSSLTYIFLSRQTAWKGKILDLIYESENVVKKKGAPLVIQSTIFQIWSLIYENAYNEQATKPIANTQLSILKDMLSYVQEHYTQKIYLEDIAKAGNVSISACNIIYKKYLRESPIKNLLNYRLSKSCELLTTTNSSVTEIALDAGFTNSSYFVDAFRKTYNCTPKEYRQSHKR